ncbi:hypothetical protein TYRP_003848 [Tyrophagus putrescentiae]|nr:hypothetical protein TYRP_003848 [Tyrophagus putrescentiae]
MLKRSSAPPTSVTLTMRREKSMPASSLCTFATIFSVSRTRKLCPRPPSKPATQRRVTEPEVTFSFRRSRGASGGAVRLRTMARASKPRSLRATQSSSWRVSSIRYFGLELELVFFDLDEEPELEDSDDDDDDCGLMTEPSRFQVKVTLGVPCARQINFTATSSVIVALLLLPTPLSARQSKLVPESARLALSTTRVPFSGTPPPKLDEETPPFSSPWLKTSTSVRIRLKTEEEEEDSSESSDLSSLSIGQIEDGAVGGDSVKVITVPSSALETFNFSVSRVAFPPYRPSTTPSLCPSRLKPSRHQLTSDSGLLLPVSQRMSSWAPATGCFGVSLIDTLLGGTSGGERSRKVSISKR